MKNRLFSIAISLIAIPVLLTSCDSLGGGLKLTDQAKIDKTLKSKISSAIEEGSSIYHINMVCSDPFKEFSNAVYVTYTAPGREEVKTKQIYLDSDQSKDWSNVPRAFRNRTADTGLPLSDIDVSGIAANIAKGADILKDVDMPFSGICEYNITVVSANPAEVTHEFELASKEGTTRTAKGTETSYYGMPFVVGPDGEVILDIDLDEE